MRQMLATFINTLLSADADAVCGAGWGQVSDATPTALPTQEITTTAEVPVAEIQSLVTLG